MEALHRYGGAAAIVVFALVEVVGVLAGRPDRLSQAALAGLVALALLLRQRSPLLASLVPLIGYPALLMSLPDAPPVLFFGVLGAFAAAGVVNDVRPAAAAYAVGATVVGVATMVADGAHWVGDFVLTLAFCTVMWCAGVLVRQRTHDARRLSNELVRAEEQHQAMVQEERHRIARELHDVISHGLTAVVLQVSAARASLSDGKPTSEVDARLAAVEGATREALDELRVMLGVLRAAELDDHAGPLPGLEDLADLFAKASGWGLTIDSTGTTSIDVPPALGLALYRITQEALTNAAKHAPGSRVIVTLRRLEREVELEVVSTGGDPGRRPAVPGAGRGLVGVSERVRVHGGTLEHGTSAEGYRLLVRLPLEQPTPTATLAERG